MPSAEAIVLALASLLKAAKSSALSKSVNLLISARKHLVNVALVTDVENDMVVRRIENSVERHRKLYDSEIGSKMSAGFGNTVHQKGPDLLTQPGLLLGRKSEQIFVAFHILQNTHEATRPIVCFSC